MDDKDYKHQRLEGEKSAIEGVWRKGKLNNMKLQAVYRAHSEKLTWRTTRSITLQPNGVRELIELIEKSGWLLDTSDESE